MSTHSVISKERRSARFAFLALGGLLMALLFFLPALPAASASPAFAPANPPEALMRAGVSVVRLISTYVPGKQANASSQCVGLGILVGAWVPNGSEKNAWILTDGSLVSLGDAQNPESSSCLSGKPSGVLTQVTVLLSSFYNASAPVSITLQPADMTISCQAVGAACANGAVLLGFHSTQTLPYVDIPLKTGDVTQAMSIGLESTGVDPINSATKSVSSASSVATAAADNLQQLIKPVMLPVNGGPNPLELGTPVVNNNGDLTSLHLSGNGSFTVPEILTFLASPANKDFTQKTNVVHDQWNNGITALYNNNDAVAAQKAFDLASAANSQFQGGKAAIPSVAAPTPQPQPTQTSRKTNPTSSTNPTFYWLAGGVGVVVLLAIALVLLSLVLERRHRERQRKLNAEYAEAERRAAIEARRIAEMEAAQGKVSQALPPLAPIPGSPMPADAGETAGLRCPRCGERVPRSSNFCTNCRLQLSPSESGLHLRFAPQQMSPARSAAPANGLENQPTVEMAPEEVRNGTTDPSLEVTVPFGEAERTLAYKVRQGSGRKLGFIAAARSDPGFKRKYKPNEDSLFAAQGIRNGQVISQPFGLFVVADGMGGHANGQDASRLAIQTIVDYMLPRLLKQSEAGDQQSGEFAQLLVTGVQQANQAVHQQNVEQHGDMGTTMTGVLLVDTTAYVINVGDSRTYLYRRGEGLSKVTNDHSVVASLVEAGIIKPDDIYTHPKRNQIYRSLGEKPAVEVDSFVVQLQEGDIFLVCSDGLWDMVRDPQIEAVIKAPVTDLNATGEALIQAALDGGGEDNVSVIVVQVIESPQRVNKQNFQLLAKPESVHIPQI